MSRKMQKEAGRVWLIRFTYPLAPSENIYKHISREKSITSIKGVLEQVDGKHKFPFGYISLAEGDRGQFSDM